MKWNENETSFSLLFVKNHMIDIQFMSFSSFTQINLNFSKSKILFWHFYNLFKIFKINIKIDLHIILLIWSQSSLFHSFFQKIEFLSNDNVFELQQIHCIFIKNWGLDFWKAVLHLLRCKIYLLFAFVLLQKKESKIKHWFYSFCYLSGQWRA